MDEFKGVPLDLVVTVCSSAAERCPTFPGPTETIHVPFDDPPALAKDDDDEEQALAPYRRVRDEIRAFIETLPQRLGL